MAPKSDHPDSGYAALKAKADAVYAKNKEALAEKQAADKAREEADTKAADEAKAAKKTGK